MGEEWDSGGYGGHVSGEAATEHTGCVALGELLSARERERERARERDLKSTKSSSFSKIKVYFQ
jgi:hypothetical protein